MALEPTLEIRVTWKQVRKLAAAVAHREIELKELGQEEKWPGELRELEDLSNVLLRPADSYFRAIDQAERVKAELNRA